MNTYDLDNKQVTIPLGELRRIRDRLRQLEHRAPGVGIAELFRQVAGLHQRLAATSPGPVARTATPDQEKADGWQTNGYRAEREQVG